jgi:putative ABC transport system permease protein
LLNSGSNVRILEERLNKSIKVYTAPVFKAALNMNPDEFAKSGNYMRCSLMPLTGIHLYSNVMDELGANSSVQYVYIFSAIAIFILLIACINFMNLSTARSSNRAKEVGVRKVLGSLKNNLILQFLTESFLVTFLSFIIAIIIATSALPLFNQVADKHIDPSLLLKPPVLSATFLIMVIVGLLAGSYPAFFLSSFQPIEVLKNNLSRNFKGSTLRNVLVVFQFSISIILTIGTVVIYIQLEYIHKKNIGFNKEQVLIIHNTNALNTQTIAFRNELLRIPDVKNATITGFLPVSGVRDEEAFSNSTHFDPKAFMMMEQWDVDENFISTMQMQIKSGRNFSAALPTDSSAIIINETAAGFFGKGNPINKKLYKADDLPKGIFNPYTVIGVIHDFNFNSLHEKVGPLILRLQPDFGSIAVRLNTRDIFTRLTQIKNKWKSMVPLQAFNYSFLDEEFDKQYASEKRTANISMIFSVLAIFIACLGLFGLVTFAVEQRTKEIGIRKVLGAAITDIIHMLSKDFVKLIFISILISSPISWWIMNRWLQDFAYRINISWLVFVGAGLLTLMIALITTIFMTVRAALANPVKCLRME